jgi:tetratricopeptide (TPR) repeat protein
MILLSILLSMMLTTRMSSVFTIAHAANEALKIDGLAHYNNGMKLFDQGKFDEAATDFWQAYLKHKKKSRNRTYNVGEAYQKFLLCYLKQNKLADGLAFISLDSFRRRQFDTGREMYQQALLVDPENDLLKKIAEEFGDLVANPSDDRDDDPNPEVVKYAAELDIEHEVNARDMVDKNDEL